MRLKLGENPFEIGLGRLVDLEQPADMGKAALREVAEKAVSRRLVGVEIEGEPLSPSRQFWPLLDGNGESVGRISSSVWTPRLKKSIALGRVKVGRDAIGTRLDVDASDEMRSAVVVEMPFYDPKKQIAKGV